MQLILKMSGKDGLFRMFDILHFDKGIKRLHMTAVILNAFLPLLSAVFLAAGIASLSLNISAYPIIFNIPVYILATIISLLLHELGHFNALLAYGCRLYSAGVQMLLVIPIGLYVKHSNRKLKSRHRIQAALAGIEMQMLFSGICLLTTCMVPYLHFSLALAAYISLAIALVNLLPKKELDGEEALSALLGVDSISALAKHVLSDRAKIKELLHQGIYGIFRLLIYLATYAADLAFYLVIATEMIAMICLCANI